MTSEYLAWIKQAERLFDQKQYDEARDLAERALRVDANCAAAHQVVGLVLSERELPQEAIGHLTRALALRCDLVASHNGLGRCYYLLEDLDRALRHFDAALYLQPDHAFAHFNRGMVCLKRGQFREGWLEYEWRWKCGLVPRADIPRPRWDGSPLDGRAIMILTEQHDACFLPKRTHVTGDIRGHDIAWAGDELWIVNTRFSCLSTLDGAHSFVPRWRPPFITAYASEDRCHLNGLAVVADQPKYVTCLGQTDTPGGWRDNKRDGGVLLDVPSGQVVLEGLSMPTLRAGRTIGSGCSNRDREVSATSTSASGGWKRSPGRPALRAASTSLARWPLSVYRRCARRPSSATCPFWSGRRSAIAVFGSSTCATTKRSLSSALKAACKRFWFF